MNQRLNAEWKPEIGHFYIGADKVVRRDSHYGKGDSIETDSLTHYFGISGKPRLPVVFADQGHGRCGQLRKLSSLE